MLYSLPLILASLMQLGTAATAALRWPYRNTAVRSTQDILPHRPSVTAYGGGGALHSMRWLNVTLTATPARLQSLPGTGTAACIPPSISASLPLLPTNVPESNSSTLISSVQTTLTTKTSILASPTGSNSSALPSASAARDVYRTFLGDGSVQDGWPGMEEWVDFAYMFEYNKANIQISCEQWGVPNDTPEEIEEMRQAILSIYATTGIDPRFILAVIIQESAGCVRVITTANDHPNPGLMQSYNGTGSCNDNNPAIGVSGNVQFPCPQSEIYQQILDGTNGTTWGPGLRQDYEQQGHTDVSGYYRTARLYNGGSLAADGNLEGPCCTRSYASDIANRLTGWAYAPSTFSG